MTYRNVYEDMHQIRQEREEENLEKDPKKIEQIYKSQIPYTPGTREFDERKKQIKRTNLISSREQRSAAEDGRMDRGIKRSILKRTTKG